MLRIALFAPLRPVKSALADYVEGLLPFLRERFDITVVTSGTYTPIHPMFQRGAHPYVPWIPYERFLQHPEHYDLILYQMGDEPDIHGYMLDALPHHPGLVFLHDLVMHHAILARTVGHGSLEHYVAEMRYSYGRLGERLAQKVIAGREDILWRYPLVERILDQSLAVVGFNAYMCEQIRILRPSLPQKRIPLPFYLPPNFEPGDPVALRRTLGLVGKPVIATFGFFVPDKRLKMSIRAFQRVRVKYPEAYYLLVGATSPQYDLQSELEAEGLGEHVHLTGWQDPVFFARYMLATDVALQLRWPHIGGTPYTPIRLLGLGVPTIISDIEPLAEIPSSAVLRVPPNVPNEEDLLVAAIEDLLEHPDKARRMAAEAQAYIRSHHDLGTIVQETAAFIEWVAEHREELFTQVVQRRQQAARPEPCEGYNALIALLGETLASLGATAADDLWLRPVARAVGDLLRIEK